MQEKIDDLKNQINKLKIENKEKSKKEQYKKDAKNVVNKYKGLIINIIKRWL